MASKIENIMDRVLILCENASTPVALNTNRADQLRPIDPSKLKPTLLPFIQAYSPVRQVVNTFDWNHEEVEIGFILELTVKGVTREVILEDYFEELEIEFRGDQRLQNTITWFSWPNMTVQEIPNPKTGHQALVIEIVAKYFE